MKSRTTLVPPILRPLVLEARPEEGEHLLVYQTSTSDTALLDRLRASGVECRIYGVRRGLRAEEREGNLRFLPFSDQGFVDDLRTARGVVANGGFTLLGEAVYLHRPVLSVPVRKQFEQVLNARYLEKEGYGIAAEAVTGEVLGGFLERAPELRRNLSAYHQDGNRALFSRLDELLAAAPRGGAGSSRRLTGSWESATPVVPRTPGSQRRPEGGGRAVWRGCRCPANRRRAARARNHGTACS